MRWHDPVGLDCGKRRRHRAFHCPVESVLQHAGHGDRPEAYATDDGSEIQALRELLDRVELRDLLVQPYALHTNRPFSSASTREALTS